MKSKRLNRKDFICHVIWPFLMVSIVYSSFSCEKKPISSLEEVNLPEQVTRPLLEEDIPAILDLAISKRDVLLLDRIAWCSKRKDISEKAEDALAEITKDCHAGFVSRIGKNNNATVPSGGIVLGNVSVTRYNPPFRIRPRRKFAKGIRVWLGRPQHHITDRVESIWIVEYAVIADKNFKIEYCDLSFDIVGKPKHTYDKDAGKSPTHIQLKIIDGPLNKPKTAEIYAVASLHQRQLLRELENRRKSLMLYKSAIALNDRTLIELLEGSMIFKEKKIEDIDEKAHDFLIYLQVLGDSKDQELATTARRCLKITQEKWPAWEGFLKIKSGDEQEEDQIYDKGE